jgi:predicted Zn-dependent protease
MRLELWIMYAEVESPSGNKRLCRLTRRAGGASLESKLRENRFEELTKMTANRATAGRGADLHRTAASRHASALFALACALGAPAARAAEGFYGPVELRKNETPLMKTVTEYEEQFVRRGYRYEASEVEGMVARVGQVLAPPPTDPYIRYRFHVLRDTEENAFALPDGQVYVNTGLLAALESEAQLAAILGHEVHHTAGHHTLLEYRSVRAKSIGGMVLGPFTFGLSDIFLSLSILGYSRDLEAEADQKGESKMVAAGYDPRAMARVFEIMQEDPEDEKPKRSTAWSTHPQLQTRAEDSRARAATLLAGVDPASLRVAAEEYRRLVRRLSLDTVQELIAADYPRSAHALATRLVSEDPGDAMRHLALGDATRALGACPVETGESGVTNAEKREHQKERNKMTRGEREATRLGTPEGQENLRRNMEAARRMYMRALELDPDLAEAHRGVGLALSHLDQPEDAGKELLLYLRARPDAVDRSIVLARLKELTEAIKAKRTGPHDTEPAH